MTYVQGTHYSCARDGRAQMVKLDSHLMEHEKEVIERNGTGQNTDIGYISLTETCNVASW